MYRTGVGVPKDTAKGDALLQQACKAGVADACTTTSF